jgi:phenylacetate-CoA ligase
MSFFRLLFIVGTKTRNPDLFKQLKLLKSSDYSTKSYYDDKKKKKLKKLLNHAIEYTDFYSKFTNNISLESFSKILPTIIKKDLISNSNSHASRFKFKKIFISETSGTSGEGLVFPKNQKWDTINRAAMYRGYSWYGVHPWDRNGYLWGYNISGIQKIKTLFFDSLLNRFRLFNYDESSVRSFVIKLKKATYLHGYSSMIYEVALMAKEMGFSPQDFPKLKMIKGTSEKIFPLYQSVVFEVFGKKIISEYGAAESGIIAFECPNGHMHINEENVIVEEEAGEIVVTNLNSYSFPIIRYKLGDYVKLAPYSVCDCGRESDVILEVLGRVGKTIQGEKRKFPSLTLYYIFKNLALNEGFELQYQGYQSEKGNLELRFPNILSSEIRNAVKKEAFKYFGNELALSFKENFQIHSKDGKLKDFLTEL